MLGAAALRKDALTAARYLVDGNAMFLSAAEAAWRSSASPYFNGGGVVVAIGYPLDGQAHLFSARRIYDLTPPSPTAPDGYGGAEHLLAFIADTLKPFVESTVLLNSTIGRQALYGHSFGGLLALYALFSRTSMFDCYVASSPSFFWDDLAILKHEERFCHANPAGTKPAVMLFFGSYEQDPLRRGDEGDEDYVKRRADCRERAIRDHAQAMCRRLQESQRLHSVTLKEYPAEDHGSVVGCSLSRCLSTFFEEWLGREA